MAKATYVNVYRGSRGRIVFGYCRFRSLATAKAQADKDGSHLYTIRLTRRQAYRVS